MDRQAYNNILDRVNHLETLLNGGRGSGNFGHSGRPGLIGGSGKGGVDSEAPAYPKIAVSEEQKTEFERAKRILGKDVAETVGFDVPNRFKTLIDADGKMYSYDSMTGELRDTAEGKEIYSEEYKKALADDGWSRYEIKGAEIKKKLKGYGINTEGLSVSKQRGGYSVAWYVSGDGTKTDLRTVEKILRTKLESYEVDERTGEILLGGNTYVFVTDTHKYESSVSGQTLNSVKLYVDELAKIVNGGKGSGNFGHSGRPGKVGGSGDGEAVDSGDETDEKTFKSKYKAGDVFTKGGVTYTVEEGENGLVAVSRDGKITTMLPDELRHEQTEMVRVFDEMRDDGVPPSSPRYQAAMDSYRSIQGRAIKTAEKDLDALNAPGLVKDEVKRFLTKVPTLEARSIESYYKTATGALESWAKGNGGIGKPVSDNKKAQITELKEELDSLYERFEIMSTPKGFRE